MSIVTVPLPSDTPFFTLRTTLSGQEYIFTFRWNQRSNAFSFNLDDGAGVRIISSVRFNVNMPLTNQLTDTRSPLGVLMAIDTTGQGLRPTLEDMGTRVKLVFIDAESLAAL